MKNLRVALLLHFYQPWWQAPEVLKRIVSECYRPILKIVNGMPGFCFSANVNYSLLELLANAPQEEDYSDVIFGFEKAAEERKIELLGSTAYHPVMPLIPKDLQIRQMIADTELKKACWGIERNCGGLFLPEMAFTQHIIGNVQACGYDWSVLDDELFRIQYGFVPFCCVPSLQGFRVYLRSNYWSNLISFGRLSFDEILRRMDHELPRWTGNAPAYLIIAMDAETFGHHHPHLVERFLEPMLKSWGSGILTPIEEIGRSFPRENYVRLYDGSWSTSEDDYRRDDPFPLWNSKFNPHHGHFWKLINIALRYQRDWEASWDCLKITSSCHPWWISGRPSWQPAFMMFAADKAMEIIERSGSFAEKSEARGLSDKLRALK